MKTSVKLFAFLGICMVSVSCKNDYNCKCTTYNNGTVKTYDTSFVQLVKKDAIYFCDKLESDWMKANLKGDNKDTIYRCDLNKVK